jgi:signal transduction histidine kinase
MESRVAPVNESAKVKILLVDDQEAKLLSYEVILAGMDETLIKASSACEAFECLLKNDIALILIDVCMPDLGGFELAALIREHPRFQRIGIIFVSAVMTSELHQLRGYDLGAYDYVPVPVVPELLRAKIKLFVDLHRRTRRLEHLNAELEERVLERTAALRRSNAQLEQRIEVRTREREVALGQLYAAQQMESIGQLTGEVAHDFNNLLMVVLSSLTLLQKRLPRDDPQCGRLLHIAIEGGRRGASLARRLLAFSRRQELKPESVDIGKMVIGMKDLLAHALGVGVELKYQIPSALPPVLADPNQLELALLSVALNARVAMPDGGRLTISAERSTNPRARDLPPPPGDYICIRMVDDGVDMDDVEQVKTAEPSFAAKGCGMRTSLGLSAAQGIAVQFGGWLRTDSTPNLGTTVELWLPQNPACSTTIGHKGDFRASGGLNAQ